MVGKLYPFFRRRILPSKNKDATKSEAAIATPLAITLVCHLATMMNTHFAAAVPNLRIMEHDVDRLPWDDELFTHAPKIEDGHIIVPQGPGWGTEPNEEVMRDRPPKVRTDYLGMK